MDNEWTDRQTNKITRRKFEPFTATQNQMLKDQNAQIIAIELNGFSSFVLRSRRRGIGINQ